MILFCELPLTRWCPHIEDYEPLAWLEKILAEEPRMPAIIFMHVPPDREWDSERLAQWKDIVHRYDVQAVICGHLHADELSLEGRMPIIAVYACTNKYGNIPSFKVYSVDKEGKISFKTHYLDRGKK
ncbi:MAG: metallophosphoesterase [Candidatus Lindowbacteria bacterium]|nr:metallophosphoesterase [Candidatus Lindowbacteria bacterium]